MNVQWHTPKHHSPFESWRPQFHPYKNKTAYLIQATGSGALH